MPSPFPGMDPYLEESWGDVHAKLIVYTHDALRKVLPSSLRCRVERRVFEQEDGEDIGVTVPDVQVVERSPNGYRLAELEGASKPLILDAVPEPISEKFLEIRDKSGNRLVTQIEYLSPANKRPGPSRRKYVEKQRTVCRSDANLVEIDLVRAGEHAVAVPLENFEMVGRTPYVACVRRATVRHKAEVYPIPFDRPLPAIRVPLRPSDGDVVLALQPLIEAIYEGYEGDLDYAKEPVPALSVEEAKWVDEWLCKKGVRKATPQPKRRSRSKG